MSTKKIDLSGIKENDLDKTASFTDLMSRSERKRRKTETKNDVEERKTNKVEVKDDIEDMIDERKRSTKDLTIDLEKAKKRVDNEEEISKTQTLDITRQMKFNLEETKLDNYKKKKKGISVLNVIGELNLLCVAFYIYRLVFTDYQDNQLNYTISGSLIILLVFLFGLSIIGGKKTSNFFKVLNILAIFGFIIFNILSLI